jgi:hypothetical protein
MIQSAALSRREHRLNRHRYREKMLIRAMRAGQHQPNRRLPWRVTGQAD